MSPDQGQCAFGKQEEVGVATDAGFLGDSGDFQIRAEGDRYLQAHQRTLGGSTMVIPQRIIMR